MRCWQAHEGVVTLAATDRAAVVQVALGPVAVLGRGDAGGLCGVWNVRGSTSIFTMVTTKQN